VDHYCFAQLYWYLAKLGQGSGSYISEDFKLPAPILSKSDGDYVNLKETLDAIQNYDNNY